MTKLVTLDKDYNIKLKSQIEDFLNPDFVYVPFLAKENTLQVEKQIKKGSLLFENHYSSVSGKMVGLEYCLLPDGTGINCLAIANDYQEKVADTGAIRKRINHLPKEEVLASIYDETLKTKIKKESVSTIVISGIDDEPYIANEIFVQKNNTKAILETIDVLLNIFTNSKAIVVIKNIDSENIFAYNNFLGTYKNIELRMVDDLYLIGKEEYLIDTLHIKDDYLYLKASEVYSLYVNLKKRKPQVEKYITITGDGISFPRVINVKLGTKVIDILNSFYKEDLSLYDVYVNGLMQGKKMDIARLIVTKDFHGLVIMKKNNYQEMDCIKCGKCIQVCPIDSNPLLAYKTGKKVKCIACGLCTYICPSYIHLQKYLRGEKDE